MKSAPKIARFACRSGAADPGKAALSRSTTSPRLGMTQAVRPFNLDQLNILWINKGALFKTMFTIKQSSQ
jgi:hypothetical protein